MHFSSEDQERALQALATLAQKCAVIGRRATNEEIVSAVLRSVEPPAETQNESSLRAFGRYYGCPT